MMHALTKPGRRAAGSGPFARVSLGAWWLAAACSTEHRGAPGEVVVVVSTDLDVPADIDTLRWSVSGAAGSSEGPSSRAGTADAGAALPGTLAVVAGPKTSGPVRIELEALAGGANGTVRVRREAVLAAMPPDGVKKNLFMALDWLCSTAGGASACPSGSTCVAGSCADASIAPASLPDYASVEAGPCFDTLACFANAVETVPVRDPATRRCMIPLEKSSALRDPTRLNIALVVDTSTAGNYGACAPNGACLVPLEPEDAEGWTAIRNGSAILGVALPDAVCTIGVGAQISAACPAKTAHAPICPTEPTCARSETLPCPAQWIGYSCAGAADATAVDPALTRCWPARPPDPDGGPAAASNLSCCAAPAAGPSDPLLIDDMSGEPFIKIAPSTPGTMPGKWFVATDDANAVISPQRGPAPFQYTPIARPVTGPDGGPISVAACVSAPNGFSGHYLIEGFNFASTRAGVAPFDVHGFTGVRFVAWSRFAGQPLRVDFPDKDTDTEIPKATCLTSGDCGNHYGKDLALADSPAEYVLRWSDLSQQSYPGAYDAGAFDESAVTGVNFTIYNSTAGASGSSAANPAPYPVPVEVCVSGIYFTL